jgi:thiol-disulfide isomerase/thioredoxin
MPFETEPFDDVAARARREGLLLVVDFTATWCEPCKAMERTTWPDPRVSEWLRSHALAVKVDVDAQPELAKRHRIRSMPTVVLLRDDVELDRRGGMVGPEALVTWLDGASRGRTRIDELRAPELANDVRSRHDLGRALHERGDLAGATEHLLWVWRHALEHEPAYVGVRHSFLVEELRGLAAAHPPARAELVALRDEAQAAFEKSGRRSDFRDWASLASAVADQSACLAWFDGLVGHPPNIDVSEIERALGPALKKSGRLPALGRLYGSPEAVLAPIRSAREAMLAMPDFPGRSSAATAAAMFQHSVAKVYAAYLAASREDDARELAQAARAIDPSPELDRALVRARVESRTG